MIHLRMRYALLLIHFGQLKTHVLKRIIVLILKFALISKFFMYLVKREFIAFTLVVDIKLKQ